MNANLHSSLKVPVKTCTKCKNALPADLKHFYKNSGGKFGVTPRCKTCVDQDNKEGHARRLSKDPEKIRRQQNERTKKNYYKDIEKSRERHRRFQAKRRACPETRAAINMAKRGGGAGLTEDDFRVIFSSQKHKCAICRSDRPHSKAGWNVDHCHKTNEVRFILCAHCNRGLGAFRDDPDLMRKAANMLEARKYQGQADAPVSAILEDYT